jgi:competence protein ComEA
MITRIGLLAAALGVAAFVFWHPASRTTIQAVPLTTAGAAQDGAVAAGFDSGRHHGRRPHGAAFSEELIVYVAGAVKRPGLYRLRFGDRYAKAVALAGGLSPGADAAGIDLAQHAGDGEEVYVPAVGDGTRRGGGRAGARAHRSRRHATPPPEGSVDVNAAEAWELAAVPGIGRAVAGRIVALREREGSFASLDELLDVAGMTQGKLERARPYLRDL